MKHKRIVIALVLLVSLLLSSCGQAFPRMTQTALLYAEAAPKAFSEPAAKAEEEKAPAPETAAEAPALLSAFREAPADVQTVQPMAPAGGKVEPVRVTTDMFRAKFEGSAVSGSGETVGGVYRFAATQTDGEAWHVKLECNYPTVAGRDYRISYRFHSDVAGKVKFGDFQEFEIREGDNSLTGILTASSGTSYLDLQLGMLPPFTIDFSEIEVEEYADEVDYENALPSPVNFERETLVFEKHDQGYAPVLTRSKDGVSVEYLATSWDSGIWKSRLYIRTGLIPESGVHYRVTADIKCDQDMPFEVLFNNGDEEKGYGALYGQNLTAGETKTCEAVITGSGDGDDLVMQFSLGEVPEGSVVDVSNLRVEKIKDHYTNELPAHFALDTSVATGKTLYGAIPTSFKNLPLTNFSYSGTDTVYEGHDDDYEVNLEENGSSATLNITRAPESGRGVWKVRLYAATGVELEAGTTYQVCFDLAAKADQDKYEVLLSGDTDEAYGADKGRSLTAGGTDHVEFLVTPDESHGPLTIRLQLGETDTTAGNSFTLSNLSVKKLSAEYKPVGTAALSTGGTGNVSEEHYDGVEQTLTASGDSAALNITAARSEGAGGVWSSKLLIRTGITPDAGAKYRVGASVDATGATGKFEFLLQNTGSESLYDYQKDLSGPGSYGIDFTAPASGCGELVLVFQLGDAAADNTITVSDINICKIDTDSTAEIELPGFAYPTVTQPAAGSGEPGYEALDLAELSAGEGHDDGYEQTLDGLSLTISQVPAHSIEVWTSKLLIDPGVVPQTGEKYRVTASLSSAKAMDFEVCYNNGSAEKGYGALYGQSIGAGETKELVSEFEVAADAAADKLILQFQVGKSPAENTITVNSVKVERIVPGTETVTTVPEGYHEISLSGTSASEAHGDGYEQTLSGNALSISNVPSTGVWSSKLFVDTGLSPESGAKYKVTATVSSAKAMDFEICYNRGSEEKGYSALYGQSIAAGESKAFVHEFTAPTDKDADKLILQLQVGASPAENTITVSSVKVEKFVPGGEGTTVPAGYQSVSLTGSRITEAHDSEYVQTLSGSTLTINEIITPAVWRSKLFVNTGAVPEAGQKYRVTANVTSTKAMDFEICYNNGSAEKGYGALYGQSIGENETKNFTGEFELSADATPDKLILQFQLGNSPKDNTVTVNSVTLEKLVGEHSENVTVPEGYQTVPVSLGLESTFDSGYDQSLVGSKLTVSARPENPEYFRARLFVDTGVKLEAGGKYQGVITLTSSMDMDFEVNLDSGHIFHGGMERKYGALRGLHIDAGQTAEFSFTIDSAPEDGSAKNLFLQMQLGKSPVGNVITLNGVTLKKWEEEHTQTQTVPAAYTAVSLGEPTLTEAHDGGYEQTVSSKSLSITRIPEAPGIWKSKLFYNTDTVLEVGAKYRVTANVSATKAMDLEVCYNNGGAEKGYGALYSQSIAEGETKDFIGEFEVSADATPDKLILQFQLGNSPAGNSITVNSVKLEKWEAEHTVGSEDAYVEQTLSTLNAWEQHDDKFVQTLEGRSLTISEIKPNGVWLSKLFVDTHETLEAGAKYKVTANVTTLQPLNYELCYNSGEEEKGYDALYSLSLAENETKDLVREITVPADMTTGSLVLQFQLGESPAGNTFTVNSVKLEKWDEEHQETEAFSGTTENVPVSALSASESHAGGYEQTLEGTTLTISALPKLDSGIWSSKLYVDTHETLEAGEKYRVTASVSSTRAMDFELLYNSGPEEKGYGALYGQSIADSETKDYVSEFEVAADKAVSNLVLQFQLGNSQAPCTFTVNSVTVEKWSDGSAPASPKVVRNSFDLESSNGAAASLSGDGSSATATVTKSGDDWHIKLYAKPGVKLEEGKAYQVSMTVSGANGCAACYKNTEHSGEGDAEVVFGTETVSDGVVTHSFTAAESGTLEILLKIGNVAAGTAVKVSDVSVSEAAETVGENLMTAELSAGSAGNVSFWAHEDYAAALSGDGSSASLAISNAPDEGKEAWKVKLFVDTGIALEAGKLYRISADVSADAELDYELCCTDGVSDAPEHQLAPTKSGLHAAADAQTVLCDAAPAADATLNLQFNLGNAAAPCTVSISNVKVEEMTEGESETVLPSFSYDSVGSFGSAADDGYIVSLDKAASSATFRILQAPASDRNPWNVKLNVRTGFTPEKDKGYRVSFDLNAALAQSAFEVFYDGNTESAYGAQYGQSLSSGKNSFSYIIYPGESKGELVLQLRCGKTDGTAGNTYTFSNLKIDEVTFRYTQTPETKEVTTLVTQNGYIEQLERTRDRATVRIEKTPSEGREAWKSKLFVETGVTLRPGQKYRVSMDVKSIIPTPFEVCFNNGGVEKGLGAMFGLISTPSGQHVEYITYAKEATQLVIQLSLGNCAPPNSIMLSNVKVEKAGAIDLVSDTIYTF